MTTKPRIRKRPKRAIYPNDSIKRDWMDDDNPGELGVRVLSMGQIEQLVAVTKLACPDDRKPDLKRRLNRRISFWATYADAEHDARQKKGAGKWEPPQGNAPWHHFWDGVADIFEIVFSRKATASHIKRRDGTLKRVDSPFVRFAMELSGMIGQKMTSRKIEDYLRADRQPKYKTAPQKSVATPVR